ncbi:MAG: hypothetical protein PVJ57_14455 [Phycisphaerae bacterium]|jgi:hypothetical protein
MPEADHTPIVLGLYRHGVPEGDTLRKLLRWMRDMHSMFLHGLSAPTSIEACQELIAVHEFEEACQEPAALQELSKWLAEWASGKSGSAPPPGAAGCATLDDATIERLVQSNDQFPERVTLTAPLLWHMAKSASHSHVSSLAHAFMLRVGYADGVPDNVHAGERRLVQVETSADRWLAPDLPVQKAGWPALESSTPVQEGYLECLLKEYASHVARVDYATLQRGRPLPGPGTLCTSNEPLDYHQLFLRLPRERRNEGADLAVDQDWLLERQPAGIYTCLRHPDRKLSHAGQRTMARLRDLFTREYAQWRGRT